ncbi:hypothetical protein N44_04187 [Microcystis aeruginosa NIES-44]|uniref:Uncharacterized protein n=1 Tax=Microcystis aeruginosa NIES-44 TaxID=449439 RepID=A0A0A1VZT7_MICAE|nr:hypothetical protein N44_04187 [Microcystis aeruginosa NIES-44]
MVSLPMNYPTVEKDSCYISYPSKIGQRYGLGGGDFSVISKQ